MRIFPEMVAKISCPFSSLTRNIALDKASRITPSCLIKDCFAILKRTAKVTDIFFFSKLFARDSGTEKKNAHLRPFLLQEGCGQNPEGKGSARQIIRLAYPRQHVYS